MESRLPEGYALVMALEMQLPNRLAVSRFADFAKNKEQNLFLA